MSFHESPLVFIFSRFTSEALLFEALLIFTLLAFYCSFFILRKRKFGSIEGQIPAGVVKAYLNELIVDAEQLRAQLFGLLSSAGVPAHEIPHRINELQQTSGAAFLQASAGSGATASLEAKIAEQAKQIETFVAEKARIEADLIEAKNKGATAPTGDAPGEKKLQEKIGLLEGKLAEYSVIEDDLANLKRLQQENAQLKAALGGKAAADATAAPAPVVAPAAAPTSAPTATAAPVTATASPPDAAGPETGLDDALAALTADAVQATPAPAAEAKPAAPDAAFEGLVDQVEQSLQPTEVSPSTTPAPTATIEKSDADLVAEFEKMLNG
jgi:hypothetical protein